MFTDVIGGEPASVLYRWNGVTYFTKGSYLDTRALSALGVQLVRGRNVTDADGEEGAPPTFLITDQLWADRFNRDPSVLGATFTVNGVRRTLIAILPARFRLSGADLFMPMTFSASTTDARFGGAGTRPAFVWAIAQLKPGVTTAQAADDIAAVARRVADRFPGRYPPTTLRATVRTLADLYTSDSLKNMVRILAGAVVMLLLIACTNVANLLLVRATANETELALRASLGASRARLLHQLLAESFVLAASGAALGAGLAYAGMLWVRSAIPPSALPSEMELRFSSQALLAALAACILTTLLCGLAPALKAARGDLQGRLLGASRGTGARSGRGRVRATLVAVQVSLAIVLLVGAGLMMRTLMRTWDIDPGFHPAHVLAAQVQYPDDPPRSRDQRLRFVRQAVDRIRAIPGGESVSPAAAPPHQRAVTSPVAVLGMANAAQANALVDLIGEDFFRTVGVPLVGGRVLSQSDVDGPRAVAVVNRRFQQQLLAGANPIGRVVTFAALDDRAHPERQTMFEIVGVVGDTRDGDLRGPASARAYIPHTYGSGLGTILVRAGPDPAPLAGLVRREAAAIDPDVALINPGGSARGTMVLEEMVNRAFYASPAFGTSLMMAFGAVGLVLSAIGVFSVMAYTVSLQTRDIGIRMALGADPGGIVRTIVLKGLRPIALGAAVGVAAAYGLSRVLANQIYGISATDPWTFAGVVLVLGGVGVLACVLPARRATRVDPLVALRTE